MAKQIIQNPVVVISGGTVSANCAQVTISQQAEEIDATAFDSTGFRAPIGGLKTGTVSFTWHNDYASGGIDQTFNALLGGTASFEVRPAGTAAAGSSSPKYTGTLLILEWNPIDSAVGDLATVTTTWPSVGAITRGTA
jgi:hypothetical protein